MVDLHIAAILLQEIFTWGDSTRIGRSGDNRVPGHLQGIPPGETITKVRWSRGWTMEQVKGDRSTDKNIEQVHL